MTDKEIVKAMMGCRSQESCDTCALKHSKNCITTFSTAVIGIMTRQKEELKVAKSEAIRAFGKFLIDKSKNGMVSIADIPGYVKEITEEFNDKQKT